MTQHRHKKMIQRTTIALAFTMAFFALSGCAHEARSTTLYERLGGDVTIDAVVVNLLYRIADDEEMVVFFTNTNIDLFAESLANQLCEVSDGPCQYDGPPMDRAHQHMGLTAVHFNRLVEYLDAAMQEEGIGLAARNDLLKRLAPMYTDVMRYQ